jgi:hypothetical protein
LSSRPHLIDEANFDAMAFPRLAAFAEALWTGQPRSLPEFKARLDGAHAARLRALGVKVGPEDRALVALSPAFDRATSRVSVRTEHHVEPIVFRYTTDGTNPTVRSPPYDGAASFGASGTITVRPFLDGAAMLQSATLTIDRHLAVGKTVVIWLSDDATSWREVAALSPDIPPQREDSFVQHFRQTFPDGTRARYVKVRAENAGPLPAWHPGAGGKAWIFVDEIAVR